jgi:hypothetical protein
LPFSGKIVEYQGERKHSERCLRSTDQFRHPKLIYEPILFHNAGVLPCPEPERRYGDS